MIFILLLLRLLMNSYPNNQLGHNYAHLDLLVFKRFLWIWYTPSCLIGLRSLRHHVVCFFSLLYLLSHGFLLILLGSNQLISLNDLTGNQPNSAGESRLDFLFGLVDEYSSHLFEYFGVWVRWMDVLSLSSSIYLSTLVFQCYCSSRLLRFCCSC